MYARLLRIALIAPLSALLATTAVARPASATLSCGDIPDLITIYFQKHIRFHQLSDDLRHRTIENYLRRVDPQRVLFLESDVEEISESLENIFRETEKGDCSRLRDLQQEVVSRHREVEGFVRGFVGGDEYGGVRPTADLIGCPSRLHRCQQQAESRAGWLRRARSRRDERPALRWRKSGGLVRSGSADD